MCTSPPVEECPAMPRPVTQDVTKQHKLQNVANVIKEQRRGGSSLRLMNLDLWWKMFLYAFAVYVNINQKIEYYLVWASSLL